MGQLGRFPEFPAFRPEKVRRKIVRIQESPGTGHKSRPARGTSLGDRCMKTTHHGKALELVQGDITQQRVDAIVNAANSHLAGGGGVDGAIHLAGGPSIMEETSRRYPDGCPTGSAVISGAGDLPARYVLHAVGPVWHGGGRGERQQLASTHRRCLELAREHQCRSVAFPAISTGVYGYPLEKAAETALETVLQFLETDGPPEEVRFVLFDESAYKTFCRELEGLPGVGRAEA